MTFLKNVIILIIHYSIWRNFDDRGMYVTLV